MGREKRGGKYYTAQQGEGAHNCNRTVPGSPLCLTTGVGCRTSVQVCDYSHHLIKSHIANLLSPAKVTDYTSNLLVTGSFLVASSTTGNKCLLVTRLDSCQHPFSETLHSFVLGWWQCLSFLTDLSCSQWGVLGGGVRPRDWCPLGS